VFIITDFTRRNNWWDLPHTAEAKLMTEDQVVQMKSLGIEIGSHGWSHRSLPMLNDEALTEELRRSKEDAERLLGKPVRYFAYPYGEVNDRVSAFARQAGYESAFATNQGPLSFYSDMFQIRRTLISNRADDAYLYVKLSGIEKACRRGWSILKKAIGKRPQYHPV
jgi:peptidoglycan/xylan/chitin deacetylase (PgdA/CDA1 family)